MLQLETIVMTKTYLIMYSAKLKAFNLTMAIDPLIHIILSLNLVMSSKLLDLISPTNLMTIWVNLNNQIINMKTVVSMTALINLYHNHLSIGGKSFL